MVRKTFSLLKWINFPKIGRRARVRVALRYSNLAWSFKGGTVRKYSVRRTSGWRLDDVRKASG